MNNNKVDIDSKNKILNINKSLNMNDKESIKNFIHTCILKQWILNISFQKSLESLLVKEIPHDKNYNKTLRQLYMIYKKNSKIFWQIYTPITKNNYGNHSEYADRKSNEETWDDGRQHTVDELIIFMPFTKFKDLVQFTSKYEKLSQYDAMKRLCNELKIKAKNYIKALSNPNLFVVERVENLTKNDINKEKLQREGLYTPLPFLNRGMKEDVKEMLKKNITFRITKRDK